MMRVVMVMVVVIMVMVVVVCISSISLFIISLSLFSSLPSSTHSSIDLGKYGLNSLF